MNAFERFFPLRDAGEFCQDSAHVGRHPARVARPLTTGHAMSAGPDAPRIVDFSAVVAVIDALPHAQIIEAIAAGFVSYSRGEVSVPQIQTLGGTSRRLS